MYNNFKISYVLVLSYCFVASILLALFFDFEIRAISLLSLVISIVLIQLSLTQFLENRMNAFSALLLGFGVFAFLDVFKYNIFESNLRILDMYTQVLVFLYIIFSFFLAAVAYKWANFFSYSKEKKKHINLKYYYRILLPITIFLAIIFYSHKEFQRHAYFVIIGYFLKAFILLNTYLYFKTKLIRFALIVIILFPLSMTDSSRRAFVCVLLPVCIMYVEYIHNKVKKIKLSQKVIATFILLGIFIFLNYMRAGHDFGYGYIEDDKISNTKEYIIKLKSIDTFYNTGFILENFPKKFNFYYGETYLSVLVGLIPRSIWPSKPVGLSSLLGIMQRLGIQADFDQSLWLSINQYSLSPGFIGEAYANFGFFGVLIGSIFLGLFAKLFDMKFRRTNDININNLPYMPLIASFFLMLRGDFYSATLYAIFIFIFLKIFSKMITIDSDRSNI